MIAKPMQITSTKTFTVLGLGNKIRLAREADPRPLTTICQEIDMSSNNWYRIEKELQTIPLETLRKIETVLGVDFGVNLD